MSTLEAVREEIVNVEAKLNEAKREGKDIRNPGVVALNSRLAELYKEETHFLSSVIGATAAAPVAVTLSPESIQTIATAIATAIVTAIEERRTASVADMHTPSEPEVEEIQETGLSVVGSRVQIIRGLHSVRKDACRYLRLLKKYIMKLYPNFKVHHTDRYASEIFINQEVFGSSVTKFKFHYTAGEVKKVYMTLLLSESMETFLTFCKSDTFSPSGNENAN